MLKEEVVYKLQEIRDGMEVVDINIREFKEWWKEFGDYAKDGVISVSATVVINQLKRLEELIVEISGDVDELMSELRVGFADKLKGGVNGEAGSSKEDGEE